MSDNARLQKQTARAKRGRLHTVHGDIETPVFMNVGTAAAIKGAVSTADLQQIGTQVELSNNSYILLFLSFSYCTIHRIRAPVLTGTRFTGSD